MGPHPLLVDEDDLTQDLDSEFQSDLLEMDRENIFRAELIHASLLRVWFKYSCMTDSEGAPRWISKLLK